MVTKTKRGKRLYLVTCMVCGKRKSIAAYPDDMFDWKHNDKLIQNAMPYLSRDQRELLISQTCGACFEELER